MENTSNSLPITIVIFGASGDLTNRKLIPALYNLHCKGRLPNNVNIVGMARTQYTHDQFREEMRDSVKKFAEDTYEDKGWEAFASHLWYTAGDLKQAADYETMRALARKIEGGPSNRMYYLSVGPALYVPVVENLGKLNMAEHKEGWRRIIVEKPFGIDLDSARELNKAIHKVFDEDQVYRIDHYLGKETAQNILFFRFANAIFEPIWNSNYIDHIQITVAEDVDVGTRAGYYDQSGIMRDMFQNHLLQLLSLVAMEPPASFNADALRNEKVKVLSSIRPIEQDDIVRGRYKGYEKTPDVAPDSHTATYAAIKFHIDNWRWQGVPFYMRSGKALAAKVSEIVVQFKLPPHMMFRLPENRKFTPNRLSLCIQPDEGIHLQFEAKVPGSAQDAQSVDMEFHYRDFFGKHSLPDAYERLLLDALHGDAALFTRADEIEAAWKVVDPLIKAWKVSGTMPITYESNTWGPKESDDLLTRDGREWIYSCIHDHDETGHTHE